MLDFAEKQVLLFVYHSKSRERIAFPAVLVPPGYLTGIWTCGWDGERISDMETGKKTLWRGPLPQWEKNCIV
jgi:hypothetical protein